MTRVNFVKFQSTLPAKGATPLSGLYIQDSKEMSQVKELIELANSKFDENKSKGNVK